MPRVYDRNVKVIFLVVCLMIYLVVERVIYGFEVKLAWNMGN